MHSNYSFHLILANSNMKAINISRILIVLQVLLASGYGAARLNPSNNPNRNHDGNDIDRSVSRRSQTVSTPCLSSFEYRVEGSMCNISSLTSAVSNGLAEHFPNCEHGVEHEIQLLFPGPGGADGALSAACETAEKLISVTDTLPFHSVLGKHPLFIKEFFDGGTYWNQEVVTDDAPQTKTSITTDPGILIEHLMSSVAKTKPLALPEGSNFESCSLDTIVCCYVADKTFNQELISNTDVCYHDLRASPGSNHVKMGYAIFDKPGDLDGATCTGFTWTNDNFLSKLFRGNTLLSISLYDSLIKEGHTRNVPGAPMCACAEQMPVIEKADCQQVTGKSGMTFKYSLAEGLNVAFDWSEIQFEACKNLEEELDLVEYFSVTTNTSKEKRLTKHIVGADQCHSATTKFLYSEGLQRLDFQ
uniref:Uncharacterized protein n=2 Tax=Corethron hystrix TaxID=216773 RepID=A0A7S1FWU6_9STRA|mmetsp:Transcript_38476/g.89467  ORF Transcript_38476/g.89467 Transcript_38476/m.89467 type:complete len:417 (+) Transcript_38476:83-1333(+)